MERVRERLAQMGIRVSDADRVVETVLDGVLVRDLEEALLRRFRPTLSGGPDRVARPR
jgi:hypothetical protein